MTPSTMTIQSDCDLSTRVVPREYLLVLLFSTIVFLLRIVSAFHYRIDSDETQHLHVVWGWTQGLLQYRDVFDNHMPLFHILNAPLLLAIGERPQALVWMRLGMIPLYGLALWCTYRLGYTLFSHRVGSWAAVFLGLFPGFFFCSVEFRTDDLWTALWLLTLVVLIEGRFTTRRSFAVGVLLGTTLSVSLKTVLLLAALGGAVLAVLVLAWQSQSPLSFRRLARCAMAALVGLFLVPLAIITFFAAAGAWEPFLYGTVQHNMLPGLGLWHRYPARALLFPAIAPLLWWSARRLFRTAPHPGIGARRALIFLAASGYLAALVSFWPLLTREDYLPFYPLLVLLLTSLILAVPSWMTIHWPHLWASRVLRDSGFSLLVAMMEIILLVGGGTLWRNDTSGDVALLADVLQLTQPTDPIMDLKGETVFRPRPFYYVLEGLTKERIRRGLIADTIPERLIATGTAVAVSLKKKDFFPPRARAFLRENYVPIGRLRVAGQLLFAPTASTADRVLRFEVRLPNRYAIVAERGSVTGWLDGTPYTGPRALTVGRHEFLSISNTGRFALLWAQAVERGFSPFPWVNFAPADGGRAHKTSGWHYVWAVLTLGVS